MAEQKYPANWQIGQDFDPNDHLINLNGRDYLNVQNRLLWFVRDQRALIVAGLATAPYVVQTAIVEHDRESGYAHFRTYVRDVLGNEVTMYGSETARDFADYAEKASTKSLGRALLALGYGTAFAPEIDEGERVVDSPVERRSQPPQRPAPAATPRQAPARTEASTSAATGDGDTAKPIDSQIAASRRMCRGLGREEPAVRTFAEARQIIAQLNTECQQQRRAGGDR
jgi:hypothetical protein